MDEGAALATTGDFGTPRLFDPIMVTNLVSLRLMLEDAESRIRHATRSTRGSALVTLDAVNERAAHLVALHRNIVPGQRATLDDLHSRLVGDLKHWTPGVWPQIKSLREARNSAQHKGIVCDAGDLPVWTAATRTYVTSLISAQFAVDLLRVVLADAITNADLRRFVEEASRHLEDGDPSASIGASLRALREALNGWQGLQRHRRHRPPIGGSRLGGPTSADETIERMVRRDLESSFATSAAEHAWVDAIRREPQELLDLDDAERVLSFVFSWITGYEAAISTWVPDRRRRAEIARRQVRQSAGPAKIADVEVFSGSTPGGHTLNAVFSLRDVPAADSFDEWFRALSGNLRPSTEKRWWVGQDGSVVLKVFGGSPGREDVANLQQALMVAESMVEDSAAIRRQREEDEAATAAERANEVLGIKDRLPAWVRELRWVPSGHPHLLGTSNGGWEVTVDPDVASLDLNDAEEDLSDAFQVHRRRTIWEALREHELVQLCFSTRTDSVGIIAPDIQTETLVEILTSIGPDLEERLAKTNKDRVDIESRKHAVSIELKTAVHNPG